MNLNIGDLITNEYNIFIISKITAKTIFYKQAKTDKLEIYKSVSLVSITDSDTYIKYYPVIDPNNTPEKKILKNKFNDTFKVIQPDELINTYFINSFQNKFINPNHYFELKEYDKLKMAYNYINTVKSLTMTLSDYLKNFEYNLKNDKYKYINIYLNMYKTFKHQFKHVSIDDKKNFIKSHYELRDTNPDDFIKKEKLILENINQILNVNNMTL